MCVGLLCATAVGVPSAQAEEIPKRLVEEVQSWRDHPTVLITLRDRKAKAAAISQADIDALDAEWRQQRESQKRPLIAQVVGAPLSNFLLHKQVEAGGQFIEVFVMDVRGLNAGISSVPSDYWQGDEPKFQKTFGVGPDAVYFNDVEVKDGTGHRAQQVSVTVTDPDTGEKLGAITAEVNLDIAALYARSAQR
ncbi:hypothetical protein [Rhodovibrio salinarum]|uniref:Uncharacterized protein n=1 Tax=Rhodovibrio salinarum TaxID=1087 RepID=A0A934QFZ1_9PROT|nr:hypothetical protein [Rhodovibrio salinarum]MBK1695825.1 hypothetical protein [Rhodovibrio salinarum]